MPNTDMGVAIRFATYVECQARALGENGFQALIGSPILTGLTSGLVTVFVALIGYRLILGQPLTLADGVTRMVRLGLVLTLTTSWPAFQTLVFNVVADGPTELASVLVPSAGLPDQGLSERVQLAYDTMRLGVVAPAPAGVADVARLSSGTALPDSAPAGRAPSGMLPQTASLFVISTVGVIGALRIAAGLLLALAPLAMLGLLFDATLGLFSGWLRALGGAALALVGAAVVTALDIVMVEGELGQQQVYGRGGVVAAIDPQGLTTLTLLFAVAMVAVVILAARMAGAVTLRWRASAAHHPIATHRLVGGEEPALREEIARTVSGRPMEGRSRAAALADRLEITARREIATTGDGDGDRLGHAPRRPILVAEGLIGSVSQSGMARSGNRTGLGRASRSATLRDRSS